MLHLYKNNKWSEKIMLSRKNCQKLQILPKEYPLPMQKCNFSNIEYPPPNDDPFYNTGKKFYKNDTDHRTMMVNGKRTSMTMKSTEAMKPSESELNILASFNNASEKSNAVKDLNKLLSRYPRVFNITIKKTIKVPKVKFRFRKDVVVTPFKCMSSKPIPLPWGRQQRKK